MATEKKAALSDVERIKENSRYLRGTIEESLDNALSGSFAADDTQLIKFHGFYQQTDRDLDSERKLQKLEPLYSYMIRIRVPGGVVTPGQWLRLDALSDRYANGTLKITTRQAIQLHGVRKRSLKATIRGFNGVQMDSIAGCGDVNRNVMCHPNPAHSRLHAEVHAAAEEISRHFTPQTSAYWEIWLNGEQVAVPGLPEVADHEPIYGKTYLPRKFKIALAIPPDNDTDVFANDIGLIAIAENGVLQGFNVAIGGGMGMTFGMPETYPRLADLIGYVPKKDLLAVAEAILTLQRDWGNRENRKFSRLKYTIDRVGLDVFKAEVERRAGLLLTPALPYRFERSGDRYGWSQNDDGFWNMLLFVEGGRVADGLERPGETPRAAMLKTALRQIAAIHDGDFRLTGNQNLMICRISEENKPLVYKILEENHLLPEQEKTALRLHSIACTALGTCTLAFAEAERYLPALIDKIDALLLEFGLQHEAINIRMTGCPNGCARPYLGEIGLVGRAPGKYNLYLGAAFNGERLNKLYREMLDEAGILLELRPLFESFALQRAPGEHFGDFSIRQGWVRPVAQGGHFHT
ncbi:MAG: NADPH-dependent assimilatory sulfite reductase hemoprotein subunit [Saprospiraceae bacterium]|nr:NADPH-dependent assimilatory sulfite reductase hemoprotein subunit [Saprospiraceae bacterium]